MSTKRRVIPPSPGSAFAQVQPPEGPELPRPGIIRSLIARFQQDSVSKEDDSDENRTASTPEVVFGAKVNVDDAMSYVLAHQNFSHVFLSHDDDEEDEEESGSFQTLDNLEHFKISARKSEALWRLEIERLVAGINDADTDVLFPELDHPDADYFLLSTLVTEIRSLIQISTVDNEGLIREKMPDMHEQENFDSGRESLRRKVAPVESKKIRDLTGKTNKGSHQTLTQEQRRKFTFALIDFVTLVLSRILVYSGANNRAWTYTCMACVAKYAAKLKVLSKDPVQFAGISLDAADEIALYAPKPPQAFGPTDNNRPGPFSPKMTAAQEIPHRLQQQSSDNPFSDRLQRVYYGLNIIVRMHVSNFISFVFNGLQGQGPVATTRTTFEICSVVYETGLERFRTWVYQERDGDLQATACQKTIPMARPAFQLLQNTARSLQARQKQRTPPQTTTLTNVSATRRSSGQQLKTHVHWNDISSDDADNPTLVGDHPPVHHMEMHSLAEAISIMVPLLFVSPCILTDLPGMFHLVTLTGTKYSENEKPHTPLQGGKFKAFFSMFTDSQVEANIRIGREDASSLSNGLMTRDKLLRGPKATEILGRSFPRADRPGSRRGQVDSGMETRKRANREMDRWIFDENAVLVSCKVYVCTTMCLAMILAVGGVIVGFTVRGRIEAVDPFNITTYCWVLAAFCILVAKSVRVETWPWRDFLRGHVRCRSITELHSVTRIPEQLILCKLLDAEDTTILNTRGPYNVAFTRRNDGGFSIDRPLAMWTMLLSGLIMVKISTDQGPAVMCLDVRRGTKYITVGHSDVLNVKSPERLVCLNLTRADSLFPLKRQSIQWRGVVGLYSNRAARFV